MDNISFFDTTDPVTGENETHVLIDKGNGEFTTMSKAYWDELEAQREQSGTL